MIPDPGGERAEFGQPDPLLREADLHQPQQEGQGPAPSSQSGRRGVQKELDHIGRVLQDPGHHIQNPRPVRGYHLREVQGAAQRIQKSYE